MQTSPTLVGTGVSNDPHGFVRVPLTSSRAVLPDLRVTDSSEAMLSGRKPPLRLMMRAVYKDTLQPVPHIRHAISEGFVVAVCCSPLHTVVGRDVHIHVARHIDILCTSCRKRCAYPPFTPGRAPGCPVEPLAHLSLVQWCNVWDNLRIPAQSDSANFCSTRVACKPLFSCSPPSRIQKQEFKV
jgi:hypothetical protein